MTCKKERTEKLRSIFLGKDLKLAAKLADVEFEVTDSLSGAKRVFAGIRALFAAFSPVMEGMLFGHMEEAQLGCRVSIVGCRVRAFEWLLAYFYGLDPVLSVENVVSILQCADRFIVAEIVGACVAFINETLAKGIDDMLPIAAEIERLKIGSIPALKEAMDSMRANPRFLAVAIKSPNFAKSPVFVVDAVIRSDQLPVTEEKLWLLVVEWAKRQWTDGRRVADSTEELKDDSLLADPSEAEAGDWRDLLRPFLPLFRFPLMAQKFVFAEVMPCGLLSSAEALSVIKAKVMDDATCAFSSVPRLALESRILSADEFCDLRQKASEKYGVELSGCKLLFRGSDNGFGASKFHELCDSKGATLTVVLTEFGHVIGGFTQVPWTSSGRYKQDTSAWLFVSRVNESKKAQYNGISLPAFFNAKAGVRNHVYHNPGYGPTFGGGHDLCVANNCDASAASHSHCTGGYSFTNVCDGVTLSVLAITGGTILTYTYSEFRVVDYEVFSVA